MIFGYGVLAFPQGQETTKALHVVGENVVGAPGTWIFQEKE